MYERFTDRARRVFQLANQEAQRLGHTIIGSGHILLGLIKEGSGIAANALKSHGLELALLRTEIKKRQLVSPDSDDIHMGKLPQTPAAKKVVEHAMEEAKGYGQNYIGTEHILLGLLRDADSVAAQVLMNNGAPLDSLRKYVTDLLGVPSCKPMRFHLQECVRSAYGHAFLQVFANGTNCGVLTMTPEEFGRFADLLKSGAENPLLNVKVEVSHEQAGT